MPDPTRAAFLLTQGSWTATRWQGGDRRSSLQICTKIIISNTPDSRDSPKVCIQSVHCHTRFQQLPCTPFPNEKISTFALIDKTGSIRCGVSASRIVWFIPNRPQNTQVCYNIYELGKNTMLAQAKALPFYLRVPGLQGSASS